MLLLLEFHVHPDHILLEGRDLHIDPIRLTSDQEVLVREGMGAKVLKVDPDHLEEQGSLKDRAVLEVVNDCVLTFRKVSAREELAVSMNTLKARIPGATGDHLVLLVVETIQRLEGLQVPGLPRHKD